MKAPAQTACRVRLASLALLATPQPRSVTLQTRAEPYSATTTAAPTLDAPTRIEPAHDTRTRFAFLAETSRLLASSLDLQSTLATAAGVALPHFGAWCMVDMVEASGTISRVAVIHPDGVKQTSAREYYAANSPRENDPIGAPRVIRTSESEFVVVGASEVLDALSDKAHRDLLREIGAQSFLIVPMRARGRTLGAITFVSDQQRRYDDADLLLAEDLGRRCAMAIDNARLYGEAEAARAVAERTSAIAEAAREDAAYAAQRADAMRDTAERAREEAETANKAKASFLMTMSHEFRTPLGIVIGYAGLLRDGISGSVNEAQQQQLRRIETASRHLLGLIEEILTLSQRNAGYGEAHMELVDLSALLTDAHALLGPMAQAKRLVLDLQLPPAPVVMLTDEGKFRQIVFNLVSNAIKCTQAGKIVMSLTAEETAVLLRVSDTGTGISADDAQNLFVSFWQSHTTAHTKGTGLGLAITRQLAQLLGGDVQLESSSNQGSTFVVRLPLSPFKQG
jgi:signal transduction histidine kinase